MGFETGDVGYKLFTDARKIAVVNVVSMGKNRFGSSLAKFLH